MEFTTMRYNREELYTCAEMVKQYILKWKGHKMKKAEFFTRACELEKCYDYAADKLNSFLFADSAYIKELLTAAYKCKAYKNSELEAYERNAVRFICNELNDILAMINHEPEKYEKF